MQTTGYLEAKECGLPSYIRRSFQHGGIWIRNFPQLPVSVLGLRTHALVMRKRSLSSAECLSAVGFYMYFLEL